MTSFSNIIRAVVMAAVVLLGACAGPETAGGIYDPYEAKNREIHAGNRNLDRALIKPASSAYGSILPDPVRQGVGNFASNLSLPGIVLNDILQFQLGDAVHNTARFVVNSTIGLAGLFDPATQAGLDERSSDFGETLHVWGFKEGAYLELAFVGPSTTRDAIGIAVDLILDPVGQLLDPPERYALPMATAASKLGDRYRYSDTVESVLYDSADSYAQSRLLYLENRRYQLGDVASATEDDLYEGLYDDLIPQ